MAAVKVILVDDQVTYRNIVKTVLKTAGEVNIIAEASNGQEFLDLLNIYHPDVVFMDIEMPVMNGIEATRKALLRYPDLVIIGLSMYDNDTYIRQLISVGARGYLLKLSDNLNIFEAILKFPRAEIFYSTDIKTKAPQKTSGQKTILIVDDFEANTYATGFALQRSGYIVLKAQSGKDALAMFDGREIDMLITDYKMPEMNGAELIKAVRQIPKYAKIPALMLSNEKGDKEKQIAANAGISAWIAKPYEIKRLLTIIEKAFK